MIQQATYSDGSRTATIKVERVDTWVEDPDSIVNFPGIVELEGDLLFLPYSRSRHGAEHETDDPARAAVSHDAGATWSEVPRDSLMAAPDPRSGEMQPLSAWSLGYLRDGTIVGIDHSPQSVHDKIYDRAAGHLHEQYQEENPAFRLHRWRRDGTAIESSNFSVAGMPWERASYQAYASILELDDGDLLAALEWVSMLPESEWTYDGRGRAWKYLFGVFIIRSSDGGKSWEFVTKFDPAEVKPTYGISDRAVDEGFDEADLAQLPNGDLLCVMRSGSYSPLYQSRSSDGGRTWSTPTNAGWQAVKPRLQVLPNGVVACASGRGAYGHPQVTHVMLSLDGSAEHWEAPFCFHTGPGCSYTSTMQRDGKLHVIFSHSDFTRDFGTHRLPTQRIRRVVLDVSVE